MANPSESWRELLLTRDEDIATLVRSLRRVAVLGIKTEAQSDQPSFYVPQALASMGIEIVPVPVYYPDVTEILGKPVFRRVQDIGGEIDCVDLFRKGSDVTAHVDDILAAKPKSVWMQLGIRNEAAAEVFARAGIRVVQDRCLMVEARRHR